MSRIDIVVFPNGGREIFGQVDPVKHEDLAPKINTFLASLESSNKPRKFTGYYDAEDASDIEWQVYDSNNPIVQVPVEKEEGEESLDAFIDNMNFQETVSMELAQIPETLKEQLKHIMNN